MDISLNKDTHLSSFATIDTEVEKIYNIEYFPKTYVTLKLLSTNSDNLESSLNELSDGNPISVDFEWKPDIPSSFHPISIFQFCSSKGVIVIENDDILLSKIDDNANDNSNNNDNDNDNQNEKDITNLKNYNVLRNFLINNKFFGKGTTTDKLKLKMMFDYDFEIEDIEVTFLKPNDLPLGFSTLVQRLVGRPSAHFKDPKVSRSDWSKRPLSVLQLLYAGFDAYSMHLCYNRIIKLKPEEIKTIFSEKNSLFTKKHKLKSELAQKQSLNLKINFFVSFNDHLKNSGSLRNQEVDPMKFVKHEEYSTKYSLFYMFLALRKIQILNCPNTTANNTSDNTNNNDNNDENINDNSNNNDSDNTDDNQYRCAICDLILPNKKSTIDHLWSQHYSDIPSIYFLWQSPAYLSGCIKQIAFASQNLITEDDHIKCAICGKKLQKFRNLYTHFRIYHMNSHPSDQITSQKSESENPNTTSTEPPEAQILTSYDYTCVDYPDLKTILYDHLNKTGKINQDSKVCHICENFLNEKVNLSESIPVSTSSVKISDPKIHFQNEKDLIEHCWNNHPGIFISLWKHRPSPYPKDLFDECNKFGIVAIEKMLCGTMYNGVYACSFCLVGFDSPGELFIHLLHRHTIIQAVRAGEIDEWPMKIRELPAILQNMIRKMNFGEILAVLEKENVIRIDRNVIIEVKQEEQKKSKKAKIKEAKQKKEKENNNKSSQNQNESQSHSQKESNSQQNKTQSNSQQNKTQLNSQQNKTELNSQQNKTQLDSQQNKTQLDSQQNKAQLNSQQNKTQLDSEQNKTQLDSQQNKAELDSEQNKTQLDSEQNKAEPESTHPTEEAKQSKKQKKQKTSKNDDDDDKRKENEELERHPFYCNECKVNLSSADERWNHLLEHHLIIDFSGVRYRCHDDLPFLSEE